MGSLFKVEWWPREKVGPGICDYCGKAILDFPCAVVMNSAGNNPHALCRTCTQKSAIKPGDDEYFEGAGYRTGLEEGNPGVNYGGRKKTQ